MAAQLQQFILGSYGMDLRYTVYEDGAVVDISTATSLEFWLTTPSGEIIVKTASLHSGGTTGILKYTWLITDLPRTRKDLVGLWRVQPSFTLSSFNGPLDSAQFMVVDCDRK